MQAVVRTNGNLKGRIGMGAGLGLCGCLKVPAHAMSCPAPVPGNNAGVRGKRQAYKSIRREEERSVKWAAVVKRVNGRQGVKGKCRMGMVEEGRWWGTEGMGGRHSGGRQ